MSTISETPPRIKSDLPPIPPIPPKSTIGAAGGDGGDDANRIAGVTGRVEDPVEIRTEAEIISQRRPIVAKQVQVLLASDLAKFLEARNG